MGVIKVPYELSIWEDRRIIGNSLEMEEVKIATIGSDTMSSPFKANQPNLNRKANGQINFTFSLYATQYDPVSGEKIDNPFVKLITNETKLKLKKDQEWYDLIVKKVDESSKNNEIKYTAVCMHINELSKNGYQVEINQDTHNNVSTIFDFANTILAETDWTVDEENSDINVETQEEALIRLKLNTNIFAHVIKDPIYDANYSTSGLATHGPYGLSAGIYIYAFYSCCKNSPYRFQFYALQEGEEFITDNKNIVINKDRQFYIDLQFTNSGFTGYTNPDNDYGFILPNFCDLGNAQENGNYILENIRGKRYVFGQKSYYSSVLKKHLSGYSYQNQNLWCEEKTIFNDPKLLDNLGGNTDFTSTYGWKPVVVKNAGQTLVSGVDYTKRLGKVEVTTANSIIDSITNGTATDEIPHDTLIPKLEYTDLYNRNQSKPEDNVVSPMLMSTGVYDNRTKIGRFKNSEKYMVLVRDYKGVGDFTDRPEIFVSSYTLDSSGVILLNENGSYLSFDKNKWESKEIKIGEDNSGKTQKYWYNIATVVNVQNTETDQTFQAQRTGIFFKPYYVKDKTVKVGDILFYEFYLCKYIEDTSLDKDANGFYPPLTPIDNNPKVEVTHEYNFYKQEDLETATSASNLKTYLTRNTIDYEKFKPIFHDNAQRVRTITVKDSNYFNALQSLVESFQMWLKFNIERNPNGSIISKKVCFKNVLGKTNYSGFRYGINLKDISRNLDSANLVTKMIVKNNSNQSADNGYCSIAHAKSNETGENYIYDFSYYINQGLISSEELIKILYGQGVTPKGKDVNKNHTTTNCYNYYNRLSSINNKLQNISDELISIKAAIFKYETELKQAKMAKEEAAIVMQETEEKFKAYADFDFPKTENSLTEAQKNKITDNISIKSVVEEWATAYQQYTKAEDTIYNIETLAESAYNRHKTLQNIKEVEEKSLIEWKKQLNLAFTKAYSRYIQEGTWQDEKYIDPELYYMDACKTMRESSFPKVSYNIGVAEISRLPGFEKFTFGLGDKTFVEDPEFFGYTENGVPYKEEIVVTEITENLDNPSANSIKVQNYKTQFQDLFQKITATVQSVQYKEGSYDKSSDLTEGKKEADSAFLQRAFAKAETVLQNSGAQSVAWGADGITVKDTIHTSMELRLVGGAILFKNDKGWRTGLTAEGISADLITAGTINAGKINIVHGDQISFRWDEYGLNAYDISGTTTNYKKGVRFDQFGIYAYDVSSAGLETYNSKGKNSSQILNDPDIRFILTWDGFKSSFVNKDTKTTYTLRFGGNTLDSLFTIKKIDQQGETTLAKITDEGQLMLKGSIVATTGDVGAWHINGDGALSSDASSTTDDEKVKEILLSASGTYRKLPTELGGQELEIFAKAGANFYVATNGTLYTRGLHARDANITGTVTAIEGQIGGWFIDQSELSDENKTIRLSAQGMQYTYKNKWGQKELVLQESIHIGENFVVTTNGKIYAQGAYLSGEIESSSGRIGGFDISGEGIFSANKNIQLQSTGQLLATNVDLEGVIKATGGRIGDFYIIGAELQSPSIILSPNQVYFPTNSQLNLNNEIFISDTDSDPITKKPTSYIYTKSARNFEIKNGTGAGLRFMANTSNQHVQVILNLNASHTTDVLLSSWSYGQYSGATYQRKLILEYTFTDESGGAVSLLTKEQIEFYVKYDGSQIGQSDMHYDKKSATINENTTSGTITVDLYTYSTGGVVSLVPSHDLNSIISWTESGSYTGSLSKTITSIDNTNTILYSLGSLYPDSNACLLGTTSQKWGLIAAESSAITTSDIKVKNTVSEIAPLYSYFFDSLRPVTYKFNNGSSDRLHTGFIAQEVEQSLYNTGLSTKDFAGLCIEEDYYALRYEEFIALNTDQIQKLKKRVSQLEQQLANLTSSQNSDIIYIEEKEQENGNNAN